jgi:hypothetical protein
MSFLTRWWDRRRRDLDVQILWPQCLKQADDRQRALVAFRLHMDLDPAYENLTEREKDAFLETLP